MSLSDYRTVDYRACYTNHFRASNSAIYLIPLDPHTRNADRILAYSLRHAQNRIVVLIVIVFHQPMLLA